MRAMKKRASGRRKRKNKRKNMTKERAFSIEGGGGQ